MRLRFLALLGMVCGSLLVADLARAIDLTFAPCNMGGFCGGYSFWDPASWLPNQTPDPTTTEILSGVGSGETLYLGTTSVGYPANPTTQAIDVQEGEYTLDGRSFSDLNDPSLRGALNLAGSPFTGAIHVGSDFGLADAKLTLLETEIVGQGLASSTQIRGNGGRFSTLVVDQDQPAAVPGTRSLTTSGIGLVGDNARLEIRRNASVEVTEGIGISPLGSETPTNSGIVVDGAGVIDADSLSLSASYFTAVGAGGTLLQVNNGRVRTGEITVYGAAANARIEVGTGGELDLTGGGEGSAGSGTITLAVKDGGVLDVTATLQGQTLALSGDATLDVSNGGRVSGASGAISIRDARVAIHNPGSVFDGPRVGLEGPLATLSVTDSGLIRNSSLELGAGTLDVAGGRIEGSEINVFGFYGAAHATFGAGSSLARVGLGLGGPSNFGVSAGFGGGSVANLTRFDLFEASATIDGPGTEVTSANVGIGGQSLHYTPPFESLAFANDFGGPASVALTNGAKLAVHDNFNAFTLPTLALGTGGTLTLDATSSAFIGYGAPTFEAGKIILEAGGFLQGNGTINGSGLPGNVAVEIRGGTSGAGMSPGHLTINGGLLQTGGELILEIGGTDPGVSYDVLEVLGSASFLGGVIKFVRVNGYTGDVGATLTFITGGGPLDFGPNLVIEDLTGFGLAFDPATGSAQITQSAVPEPGTLALLLAGCAGLAISARARPSPSRATLP